MPLPPALLKRLALRGIVNVEDKNQQTSQITAESEEIIAEDYDDVEDPSQYDSYEPVKKPQENFWIERMKKRIVEGNNFIGYKGCPNKYNVFHKCTLYCVNRWGDGVSEPKRSYLKRHNRLIKKYPLPKNWIEIYDNGCGVHYFWNTVDDSVSWLPPDHPKSQITKSAATLRRELEEMQSSQLDDDSNDVNSDLLNEQNIQKMILDTPMVQSSNILKRPSSPPPFDNNSFPALKKPKSRDLDKAIRHKASRNSSNNKNTKLNNKSSEPLDPMDPSSYSDIPRGKWSDGLNLNESNKTGVDPTVTGALFQMRPYPSPGAVLQANAAAASGKKHLANNNSSNNSSNENSDEDLD